MLLLASLSQCSRSANNKRYTRHTAYSNIKELGVAEQHFWNKQGTCGLSYVLATNTSLHIHKGESFTAGSCKQMLLGG